MQKWKIVENILNKAASKLFTGEWLLKDSRGEQFCLSTVEPNTVLLVTYEHDQDPWGGPWRLLEEVVSHEHPFQVIYVGNCFGEFSKSFRDRIMAHVSEDSDARLLFYKVLEVHEDDSSHLLSNFLVTEVVADEKGSKHFSTWKDISHSCVEFLLSKSKIYSHLQKLTKTPQETNVKLLSALFDNVESRKSSIFLRKYTEKVSSVFLDFNNLHRNIKYKISLFKRLFSSFDDCRSELINYMERQFCFSSVSWMNIHFSL